MYYLVMENETTGVDIEALKWAMNKKGWSAADLSKHAGVSKATLTLLFQGKRPNIGAVNLRKMAQQLGVSTDFLLGLTGDPAPKQTIDLALAELFETAKTLPEFRQRDLLLMARTYQETDDPTAEMLEEIFVLMEEIAGPQAREQLAAAVRAFRSARR